MRQFLWGCATGALALYLYVGYGDNLHRFLAYTLQWRQWAVSETGHYSSGHEKKK